MSTLQIIVMSISACGGILGAFVAGWNLSKSRNGYVKEVRFNAVTEALHEKINSVQSDLARLEGSYSEHVKNH